MTRGTSLLCALAIVGAAPSAALSAGDPAGDKSIRATVRAVNAAAARDVVGDSTGAMAVIARPGELGRPMLSVSRPLFTSVPFRARTEKGSGEQRYTLSAFEGRIETVHVSDTRLGTHYEITRECRNVPASGFSSWTATHVAEGSETWTPAEGALAVRLPGCSGERARVLTLQVVDPG
jgi:hypothetical protein